MSVEKIWNTFQPQSAELTEFLEHADFLKARSHSPLRRLKQKMGISIVLSVTITLLYIIPLYKFDLWTFRAALIIVMATNTFLIIKAWQLYRSIRVNISPLIPLKQQLQSVHTSFTRWERLQQKIGLFIFPVATAGGFTLGLVIGSGKDLSELALKPAIWVILSVTLVLFSFSGIWFTKKMFKLSFGKQLKTIEQYIKQLDQ